MLTKKILLIIIPVTALLSMGCNKQSHIGYTGPEIKTVDRYISCYGNVITESENRYTVSAPSAGRIVTSRRHDHQYVKEGDEMTTIENTDFIAIQQEYLEAVNMFEFYREEYARQGDLTVENATSMKKMQIARRDYQTAELEIRALALQLKILGISTDSIKTGKLMPVIPVNSPRSGMISLSYIRPGDYVQKGDPLYEITGKQSLLFEIRIPEASFPEIKPGQTLNCFPVYDSLFAIEATIRTINPYIDPANHWAKGYAEFRETTGNIIPGMTLKARILTGQDTVYLVNSASVQHINRSPFIFIRKNGSFRNISVETGITVDGKTEIRCISGAIPDSVVISGFEEVQLLINHQ